MNGENKRLILRGNNNKFRADRPVFAVQYCIDAFIARHLMADSRFLHTTNACRIVNIALFSIVVFHESVVFISNISNHIAALRMRVC